MYRNDFSYFQDWGKNFPVEKDILKISLNCEEMSFSGSFKILAGMLFELNVLCDSREDIISDISFLSFEVKKKVFVFE